MMNVLFFLFVTASAIYLTIKSPENVLGVMIEGGSRAVNFALSLIAIYSVWMMVLKILDKTGANRVVSRVLSVPIRGLFPGESGVAEQHLSVNLTANLLGTGGAATPAGIRAMEEMKSRKNRIMLAVINSTSIQLIPTTVLGLRASYGATTDVIVSSLIVTILTSALGIVMVKVFVKE